VLFVVTEGLFSMDGDSAPLTAMADWCTEFGAYLVVDEAHSTGVYGERGGGLVLDLGLENQVWARLLTLGKAMGRQGAFWLVDQPLKSFLVNYARSLIYSTAPSPAEVGHITQAMIWAQERGPQARAQLAERIQFFRDTAQKLGVLDRLWPAIGPIQAWRCPSEQSAIQWAEDLQKSGYAVKAILPPTVPEGSARLRLCIHGDHTDQEITGLLSLLKQCT
jgi:8-amino-7-oxononanoate synthase